MDTDVWLPIATLVGGAVLTYIFQSRQHDRQYEREKERDAQQYEREQERLRRDWQRQVTLDLLTAFSELYQAASETRDAYADHYTATGRWDLPDGDRHINEDLQPAQIRCYTLIALVEDEALSSQANKTVETMTDAALPPNAESADKSLSDAIEFHMETMRRLGGYARSL